MTDDQFEELLHVLQEIAIRDYTLTGAADWPLLVLLGGLVTGLLVYIWHDLKSAIKDTKKEWQVALDKAQTERKEQDDHIWNEIRRCQKICNKKTEV